MKDKNYNQNDYQTIVIKKEKAEEIIEGYKSFGWFPISVTPNSMYENLVDVEFCRDHYIKNKDDLQFLQVNMEHDINARGKLERTKHSKTLIWCLSLGLFACYCVVSAVLSFLNLELAFGIALCCAFGAIALAIMVVVPILMVKNVKKEKQVFEEKDSFYEQNIKQICEKARELTGVQDE